MPGTDPYTDKSKQPSPISGYTWAWNQGTGRWDLSVTSSGTPILPNNPAFAIITGSGSGYSGPGFTGGGVPAGATGGPTGSMGQPSTTGFNTFGTGNSSGSGGGLNNGGSAWGNVIAGVVSAAAAYFAGSAAQKSAGKLSPQQQELFDLIIKNTKSAGEFGQMVMQMSKDPMIASTNWVNSISSGDRDTINRLTASTTAGIGKSAAQSLQTMSQLAPRSGTSERVMASAPQDTALAENAVRTDAVNQGKQMQLGLGKDLASLGLSGLGQSTSGAQSGSNFLQGVSQNAQQVGSNTAGAVYGLAQNIMGSTSPSGQRNPGLTDWFTNYWKTRGTGNSTNTALGQFGGSSPPPVTGSGPYSGPFG